MPPYTARTGGVFGSGLYPDSRPKIDVGGGIDAAARGATSIIQNAYERRLANEQRQIQAEERARQHTREDVLDQRQASEFSMRQDEHNANMAASGYTPAHQETTTAVENGAVKSGGLTGKGSVTGPKLVKKTTTIGGAYDFRKSAAYQTATDTRTRKAMEFATVYKQNFPNATDEEANQAGMYAADNPSIADNILFPPRDPVAVDAGKRKNAQKYPAPPRGGAGSASSPIGKALTTAGARVARNTRDQTRVHTEVTKRFPSGLEDAGSASDTADYRRLHGQDSTLQAEGGRFRAVQDSLATRQLRESGLTPATDSTKTTKQTGRQGYNNVDRESARLAKLANDAIARGADPAAVNKRLQEQLRKLRAK